MKISNLFVGVLFSLLMSMPSFAQRTIVKQKERVQKEVVQEKKTKEMNVLNKKEIEQRSPIQERTSKVKEVPKKVVHGTIDAITGEKILPKPSTGSYISITSPESNLSGGEAMNGKITIKGRTGKRHRIEIRVQTGTVNVSNYESLDPFYSKIIEDWRPVTANSEGNWETIIDVGRLSYSAGADWDNGDQHFFTILVRDTNNRSEIKVLHLTRL